MAEHEHAVELIQQNGGQRVGCSGDCNQGRACDCVQDDKPLITPFGFLDWLDDMKPTRGDIAGGALVLAVVVLVWWAL